MFDQITIIGCGLIGSSIFKALKKKSSIKKIITFDNNKSAMEVIKKDNLLELEYEANDLKIKVVKNMNAPFYKPQETIVSFPNTTKNEDVSKTIEKVEAVVKEEVTPIEKNS